MMVEDYNAHMGYVDGHGQCVRNYMTNRTSKKWWRCVLFWLFDCACFNAYLIYSEQPFEREAYKVSHRDWLLRLAKELIGDFSGRQRNKKRKVVEEDEATNGRVPHSADYGQPQPRCQATGCERKTRMSCCDCQRKLCKDHMGFLQWHLVID